MSDILKPTKTKEQIALTEEALAAIKAHPTLSKLMNLTGFGTSMAEEEAVKVICEIATSYARKKVREQRDLMATFLAQNFNMRNIPRPKID